MTNDELNQYILHYLTEDKTNGAIMLTGDWGTGKSYYIQNSLKPFLESEENGKHQCVVVSLYGLKDTAEISKSIYLELRTGAIANWWNKKILSRLSRKAQGVTKEVVSTGKSLGSTIFKGLTEKIGINFDISDKDLNTLYKSIDLFGKLIILEDLERSGIDILEVLGYVNNLVEQDGVKVLLVANENEIKQYKPIIAETQEQQEKAELFDKIFDHKGRTFTEATKKYLETKEKTISDTIVYKGNFGEAIKQIIDSFKCDILTAIASGEEIEKIIKECQNSDIINLRTFVFACQKAADIFQKVKLDFSENKDYLKTVFFGILAFSQKLKSGEKTSWKGGTDFSVELGSEQYPLFRSCYNYIMWHSFDSAKIDNEKRALQNIRLYDKKKSWQDKDLQVLYNWWIHSENDVNSAVMSVSERLKDETNISFYEYGRLAVYLIVAKNILGCDIEAAKALLIKNLHNKGSEIDPDYLFTTIMSSDEKPEVIKEFEELKTLMEESLVAKDTTVFGFDYEPSSISQLYDNVIKNEGKIISDRAFASRLDINKIDAMLKKCNAAEMQDFRRVFLSVYGSGNIGDFLAEDTPNIEKLKRIVEELCLFETYDKIQKMQMQYFLDNLTKILAKL